MRKLSVIFGVIFGLTLGGYVFAANTDIWNLSGQGIYNGKDMVHVDSNYNLRLYNGSIVLGDNNLNPSKDNTQTTPSITVGGFYGIKVPITSNITVNGGATSVAGQIVCVSSLTTNGPIGAFVSVTATTTVLGIVDGAYAAGSTMYYITEGYATVLTTGTVNPGDLLVSSATTNGAGTAITGRAGKAAGTVVVGTVIGKALTAGAAAGDSVLALIHLQ